MKMSADIEEGATPQRVLLYAKLCGRTLAHAHAKSGDSAMTSGYLGKADIFDHVIGDFASEYTEQNKRDHAALVTAVKAGRIKALTEAEG